MQGLPGKKKKKDEPWRSRCGWREKRTKEDAKRPEESRDGERMHWWPSSDGKRQLDEEKKL